MKLVNQYRKAKLGQTVVEYMLIVGLVAVILIGALLLITGSLSTTFSKASSGIESP